MHALTFDISYSNIPIIGNHNFDIRNNRDPVIIVLENLAKRSFVNIHSTTTTKVYSGLSSHTPEFTIFPRHATTSFLLTVAYTLIRRAVVLNKSAL